MKPRLLLFLIWSALPLPAWWFHREFGPLLMTHDRAKILIQSAAMQANANDWNSAVATNTELLSVLPDDPRHRDDRVRLQVAIETFKSHQQQGIEAIAALRELLESTADDAAVADSVKRDIRTELGELYYYTGWRMRLEGSPRWTFQVDRAREQFRYLAKTAQVPAEKSADLQNLEAAIRLERMDLSELRATPLPPPAQQLESRPAEKQQSQGDDPQGSGPESAPPDAKLDDKTHGTGGNSGGKYSRPFKGS